MRSQDIFSCFSANHLAYSTDGVDNSRLCIYKRLFFSSFLDVIVPGGPSLDSILN